MKRYKVIKVIGPAWQVNDTASLGRMICLCRHENDANLVCKALNASVPAFNGLELERT